MTTTDHPGRRAATLRVPTGQREASGPDRTHQVQRVALLPPKGDAALAALVAAVVLVGSAVAALGDVHEPGPRQLGPAGYLLIGAGAAALAYRNTAPTATFAVTVALGLLYQAGAFPGGPDPLLVVVALYTLAAHGHRLRSLGLGLAACVLLVAARGLFVPDGLLSPLTIAFPTTVVAALFAGQMVASRRSAREEARAQRVAADDARERDAQKRVDAERLRIARELHDVVAHNISLINVQATMGVHLMDASPAQAAAALTEIKQASRQALRELRRILDVLRSADETEPTAPAPGLAELDALVVSTSRAGLPVQVLIVGDRQQVPSTVDVAAYRIVQESLTNALRYAGDAPTTVTLHYLATSLRLEIVDDGADVPAPHSAGHGIAGMHERAAAVGGRLRAGPRAGGGFAVTAELPLSAALP